MFFLLDPSISSIYYRISLIIALVVMSYFEARFYTREDCLPNKKEYFRISFIGNAIVALTLCIPIYEFDLIAIGVYIVKTFVVGYLFVSMNTKKDQRQARFSFFWTSIKTLLVFVGYYFTVTFLIIFGGFIYGIIIN